MQELGSGREPPYSEDLSTEAEKYPWLEAVIKKRLLKTLQAGKDLACVVVFCKV
jgi:hypothetical protein